MKKYGMAEVITISRLTTFCRLFYLMVIILKT